MRWFRRKRQPVVIPRAPETRQKAFIGLCEPHGMLEGDWALLEKNEDLIKLAYRLGLDLALHRGDSPNEYIVAGGEPSSGNGFVVVRNADA